ncbi:MAG: hypothetical protein ACREJB_14090 [Planctomycetaceae bacterium]
MSTVHALNIPEQTGQVAAWLEEHLLGLDLSALAAELSAVRKGELLESRPLEVVLGDDLQRVLDEGLSVLPRGKLRQLLRDPALLLQLQVQVFIEGGEYWHRRRRPSPEMEALVERGWERIRRSIEADAPEETDGPRATPLAAIQRPKWYWHPLFVSLLTAAAVVAVMAVVELPIGRDRATAAANGWGWDKPGTLAEDASAEAYMNNLADAAGDWFNARPATQQDLARRIGEFRLGCSTLITSDHKPLSPEDEQWLVEKCQAWAKKLDQHLADAEAGEDVLTVRDEADETINNLIKAIRARAKQAA